MSKRNQDVLTRALIAVVIVISCFITIPVCAAEKPATPGNALQVRVVTIDDMDHNHNLIFVEERRFRVSPSATIVDRWGRALKLKDLKIPCKAKITYHLFGDHRDPLVKRIRLR
jgi:hypothetical protein